jgi:hypothetical protein
MLLLSSASFVVSSKRNEPDEIFLETANRSTPARNELWQTCAPVPVLVVMLRSRTTMVNDRCQIEKVMRRDCGKYLSARIPKSYTRIERISVTRVILRLLHDFQPCLMLLFWPTRSVETERETERADDCSESLASDATAARYQRVTRGL